MLEQQNLFMLVNAMSDRYDPRLKKNWANHPNRRVASGGAMPPPPDFRFCPPPPPPPRFSFLPYPQGIFWEEEIGVFGRKKR